MTALRQHGGNVQGNTSGAAAETVLSKHPAWAYGARWRWTQGTRFKSWPQVTEKDAE